MKGWLAPAMAVAVLSPGSLQSQTPLTPPPTLDSARAAVVEAAGVFYDSTQTVLAAAARVERGDRSISDSWLLSRARAMTASCDRSRRTLGPTRDTLARGSWESPYARRTQTDLLRTLDDLDRALARCVAWWEPRTRGMDLDEARQAGRSEARRARDAVLTYERSLAIYFKALEIQGSPRTGHAAPAPTSSVEKP